jgi:hypothetical protein
MEAGYRTKDTLEMRNARTDSKRQAETLTGLLPPVLAKR